MIHLQSHHLSFYILLLLPRLHLCFTGSEGRPGRSGLEWCRKVLVPLSMLDLGILRHPNFSHNWGFQIRFSNSLSAEPFSNFPAGLENPGLEGAPVDCSGVERRDPSWETRRPDSNPGTASMVIVLPLWASDLLSVRWRPPPPWPQRTFETSIKALQM